jgi:hypothetical protein
MLKVLSDIYLIDAGLNSDTAINNTFKPPLIAIGYLVHFYKFYQDT